MRGMKGIEGMYVMEENVSSRVISRSRASEIVSRVDTRTNVSSVAFRPKVLYTAAMTYDDFASLCKTRRSIRYFDQRPVAKEDVLALLELARMAPSIENLQPWHFHAVFNKELRTKLMQASCYGDFIEGASVFIVVTVNHTLENQAKEPVWNPKELEYSCMAAMEHMLLGATAMGLGSTWVSLHHGTAHEILELPRHEIVVGGIMLGHYKKGEEEPSDGHERKPLGEMYTFHE